MIRLVLKNGNQTITELCDKCKCHVRDLTLDDIVVKKENDPTKVFNSKGEEITRTTHDHMTCECEDCHD